MTTKSTHKETFLNTHHDVLVCLFIIIATLAVYWQVRHYDFVNYDDPRYIIKNPHVQSGLSAKSIFWSFTFNKYDPLWHPLTWISLMLGCQLHGMAPGWHHLTNVLFHIISSLFLFFVLKRMTGHLWRSAFIAALFALHPLHVESVAWVTERKNVLSTFFWILVMWNYVRYVERPGLNRYLLVLVTFILGLMSKMMLVTLPFVLLLLDYWPLHRYQIGHSDGSNISAKKMSLFRLLWEKTPFFILAAAMSFVTYLGQHKGPGLGVSEILPLRLKISNALVSYVSYIRKMIWPHDLAVLYPYPGMLPWWQVAGAFLLLLSTSLLAIMAIRKRPYLVVGWLWYLGTLVPLIGFVPIGNYAMADRYAYIPLIGIFIIIAWGVPEIMSRWRYRRPGLATIATILILTLTATTWLQVRYWANSITLFEHALDVTANNYSAHSNLGVALAAQGKIDEAVRHYNEALRINPDSVDAYNNLGITMAHQGRTAEAISYYNQVLRRCPDCVETHMNLGIALEGQGGTVEAIRHYNEALRIRPDYEKAHYNLGMALAKKGRTAEAIRHYNEALRIKPNYEKAHNNLGIALAEQGKIAEAISHYSEALRIKPDYAEAHINLGSALVARGKLDEAVRHFSQALRISPDHAMARDNLRKVLAAKGTLEEAFAKIQEAMKLNPADPALHYSLGNLYQKTGELDSAVEQYQKALSFRPDFIQALGNLATVYTIMREYDKAVAVFKKLIGLRPENVTSYYNIACIYARQNRIEESLDWLEKAVNNGYENWDLLKTDKDLENIRASSYYRQLIGGH